MKKNFYILLITAVSFTACSDTLCIGDDCGDGYEIDYSGGGGDLDFGASEPSVWLSDGCTSDNIGLGAYVGIEMSCEGFKELIVDNTPPNKCDEITIIDINGNSITGFYSSAAAHEKCD